ncbi:23301_t:CDS:1, partial [Dentiscutata erythropus]
MGKVVLCCCIFCQNETNNVGKLASISSRTRHRRREREIQSSHNILHSIPSVNMQTLNISGDDMQIYSMLESYKINISELSSLLKSNNESELEHKEEANKLELEPEEADELELELEEEADKMELELGEGVNEQESLSFISINSLDETSDFLTNRTFIEFESSDDQSSELEEESSNNRYIPDI